MTGNNRHFLILILNVNGLSAPIKRHRIANWIKKQNLSQGCRGGSTYTNLSM
jgi:hypothetical protein